MVSDERSLRNISDTARWTATFRARESERADALFRDPLARRLAGDRGEAIRQQIAEIDYEWSFTVRTYLFDRAIAGRVAAGVPRIGNLAAGLDARPYRMALPAELEWIEADLPDLVAYKEEVLAEEQPHCRLERIGVDLADVAARRAAFERLHDGLVICEGLLVYLTEDEVARLGIDLAAAGVAYWLFDLASPALLKFAQGAMGKHTAAAGAPMKFGPREGVAWFERLGWKPLSVDSVFETAFALGRVPKALLSAPPPPPGPDGPIWSGAVLLQRG